MKVIAIQSSPNLDGLTCSLAKAALKGVEDGGGETELVHLNKLSVKPCIACDNGWGKCREEGVCILEDDFQDLTAKIAAADALIFATPVYWHDLSESAKTFLDRLRRCERGMSFQTYRGKKAIGIASAGGSGRGAVRALGNLEEYLRRLDLDIFDLVPVTRFSKEHKLEMLKKAGRRLVSQQRILLGNTWLEEGRNMEFTVGETKIRIVRGDITEQSTDAIVNTANSSLMGGGGVDGAIHRRGGKKILEDCRKIRETEWPDGLPTGKAVLTTSGNLETRYVIHTVGPVWRGGKYKEPELLAEAYKNSARLAISKGLKTIAFPSISTGAYGYPIEKASEIALKTIRELLEHQHLLDEVVFVLFSQPDLETYTQTARSLFER